MLKLKTRWNNERAQHRSKQKIPQYYLQWMWKKVERENFLWCHQQRETKSNFFSCVKFFITKKSNFRDDGRENDKALSVLMEEREKKIVCLGRFANRHTESDEWSVEKIRGWKKRFEIILMTLLMNFLSSIVVRRTHKKRAERKVCENRPHLDLWKRKKGRREEK